MLSRPLALAAGVALIALLFRAAGKKGLAARLSMGGAVLAYMGALSPVGDALLDPLERRFPALLPTSEIQGAAYVVVLGSGYRPRAGVPPSAALDDDGLARIVEGVRLSRAFALPLIVSGGALAGSSAPALGYAQLAGDLGVDAASIVVSSKGTDTHTEALSIASLVGDRGFVLVTSAAHMPRAMRLMLRAGAHPLPAPTAQRVVHDMPNVWRYWLPSSNGLRKVELALHEYLGLAAIQLGWD